MTARPAWMTEEMLEKAAATLWNTTAAIPWEVSNEAARELARKCATSVLLSVGPDIARWGVEQAAKNSTRLSGDVTTHIRQLFSENTEWTTASLVENVAEHLGPDHSTKSLYNTLGYLTRKGAIEHLGYGRYRAIRAIPTKEG